MKGSRRGTVSEAEPRTAASERSQPDGLVLELPMIDDARLRVAERLRAVSERARATATQILAHGRTPSYAVAAALDAQQSAEAAVEIMRPEEPLACGEGCAWCCYLMVTVSPPEVLLIAQALRESLSDDDLVATYWRVVNLDERTRGLSPLERGAVRLPCALLVEDRCLVYQYRPLRCRGHASFNSAACERALLVGQDTVDVPTHRLQNLAVGAVDDGLRQALDDSRLAGEPLELTAALRIALENPDAAERWLAGEPIFEPAVLRIGEPPSHPAA
jgi:hypothetical protein